MSEVGTALVTVPLALESVPASDLFPGTLYHLFPLRFGILVKVQADVATTNQVAFPFFVCVQDRQREVHLVQLVRWHVESERLVEGRVDFIGL